MFCLYRLPPSFGALLSMDISWPLFTHVLLPIVKSIGLIAFKKIILNKDEHSKNMHISGANLNRGTPGARLHKALRIGFHSSVD